MFKKTNRFFQVLSLFMLASFVFGQNYYKINEPICLNSSIQVTGSLNHHQMMSFGQSGFLETGSFQGLLKMGDQMVPATQPMGFLVFFDSVGNLLWSKFFLLTKVQMSVRPSRFYDDTFHVRMYSNADVTSFEVNLDGEIMSTDSFTEFLKRPGLPVYVDTSADQSSFSSSQLMHLQARGSNPAFKDLEERFSVELPPITIPPREDKPEDP